MKLIKNPAFRISILFIVFSFVFVIDVFATEPETPKVVTGVTNFAKWVTLTLTALIPTTAGARLGWDAWMKSLNTDDGGVHEDRKNKMKNTIIWSAVGTAASGIITLFLFFFT